MSKKPKKKICQWCLAEFRRSPEGRSRANNGYNWNGMQLWWPEWVQHTNPDSRLCYRHRLRAAEKTREVFKQRDLDIAGLGFKDYAGYLKSGLWAAIRRKCFDAFGPDCHFCGAAGVQIHHDHYEVRVLCGRNFKALYVTCRCCHSRGSFLRNKDFMSPKQATARMRNLACQEGHGKHIRRKERARKASIAGIELLPAPAFEVEPEHPDLIELRKKRKRAAQQIRKNRRRAARENREQRR